MLCNLGVSFFGGLPKMGGFLLVSKLGASLKTRPATHLLQHPSTFVERAAGRPSALRRRESERVRVKTSQRSSSRK